MKRSTIVRLLLVSGTATAFIAGCANDGRMSADNRSYKAGSTENGYYDSNGVWQSNAQAREIKSGCCDKDGVWRNGSDTTASSTAQPVTGTDNRPDPHATARGGPAPTTGYYDSNGTWHADSTLNTAGTQPVSGADNRPDPHATNRSGPSAASTGYYDNNGKWQSGGVSQTDRDANGRTWGTMGADSPVASTKADARSAQGWRDEKGVWHSSATTVTGYYDSDGVWRSGEQPRLGSVDTGRGYYDSNGVWQTGARDLDGNQMNSAEARAQQGYRDEKGVWHDYSHTSANGTTTVYDNRSVNDRFNREGSWRPDVVALNGNPNVSTGYYDGTGVWHSVGAPGVINIPIGVSADRATIDRALRSPAAGGMNGYYDSNGTWRSNRSVSIVRPVTRSDNEGYYDSNGVWHNARTVEPRDNK